jgi:AcrR family transcriptional regulator
MPRDTAAQPADGAPRLSRHDETRARILAAAQDILLERTSADALPLREVARRAGFAPGALYRYFEDRDDLIQSLYLAALQGLGSYLGGAIQGAGGGAAEPDTAAERLLALGDAYLRFGRERPQDLVLLFESAVPSATWADYVGVAWPFTLIVETVAAGIESHELQALPGLDAAGTAYAYWALVHGFAALQAGHLAGVAGDFQTMHAAALDAFVARLHPHGRDKR